MPPESSPASPLRAALYLRVSTDSQTVDNQRLALEEAAQRHGWRVDFEYCDDAISGAKGREKRPALDKLLKHALDHKFDVVMVWAVDRLGRSLQQLLGSLEDIQAAGCDLYIHQQQIDTRTPAGRALFGMLGVFAEFERAILRERIQAGLARAKKGGKRLGAPPIAKPVKDKARALLAEGLSDRAVALKIGVSHTAIAVWRRTFDSERRQGRGA